jgi:hypothetical protein
MAAFSNTKIGLRLSVTATISITLFCRCHYDVLYFYVAQVEGQEPVYSYPYQQSSSNYQPGSWVLTLNLSHPEGRPEYPDPPHSWQQQVREQDPDIDVRTGRREPALPPAESAKQVGNVTNASNARQHYVS